MRSRLRCTTSGGGENSTGTMGIFAPALTEARFHKSAKLGEVLRARSIEPFAPSRPWLRNGARGELKRLNLASKVRDLMQITKLYTLFGIKNNEAETVCYLGDF